MITHDRFVEILREEGCPEHWISHLWDGRTQRGKDLSQETDEERVRDTARWLIDSFINPIERLRKKATNG